MWAFILWSLAHLLARGEHMASLPCSSVLIREFGLTFT